MAVTNNFRVNYEYTSFSRWSATLEVELTNKGPAVEGPINFAFDFPKEVVPTTNVGFDVTNSGVATTHVAGTLAQGLANGQTAIFSINLGSPGGTLGSEDLPTVSYINDQTVISGPADPTNLRVTNISFFTADLFWDPPPEGEYPIKEYLVTYGPPPYSDTYEVQTMYLQLYLTPGVTYIVKVQAVDEQGGVSPGLNEVVFFTPDL